MSNSNIEDLKKRIATGDIQAMLDLGDVYAQGAAIDYEQALQMLYASCGARQCDRTL